MQTTKRPINKMNILIDKINFSACVLISMWMTLPFFRVRAGIALLLVFFVIWLLTTDLRWITKGWSIDLVFVLILFITFIPYLITGNLRYGDSGSKVILVDFPIFFIGIFINHYYMYYKKDYKLLSKVALIILVFYTIGAIQTYIGLTIYPMASRLLATGIGRFEAEKIIIRKIGIGGFGYIYASCFLFLSMLSLGLKNNYKLKKTKKIIVLITLISVLLMIYKASYAVSFMIILSGVMLVLIVKNKKMLTMLMAILGISLLLIPPTFYGNFILNIASLFSDNHIIYEKFTDLGMSFLQDTQSSQTNTRIELYMMSFNTFLEQPLFGIYGPFGKLSGRIGGHSGWFDFLGYYGLFSAVPLFLIIYYNFKKHLGLYKSHRYKSYLIVIYFLFFIMGMINPVLSVWDIGFMIFFIVPIIPLIANNLDRKPVLFSKGLDNENTMSS